MKKIIFLLLYFVLFVTSLFAYFELKKEIIYIPIIFNFLLTLIQAIRVIYYWKRNNTR